MCGDDVQYPGGEGVQPGVNSPGALSQHTQDEAEPCLEIILLMRGGRPLWDVVRSPEPLTTMPIFNFFLVLTPPPF